MGDMTKNFSRSEFACNGDNCCGHSSPISPELVQNIQFLRDKVSTRLGRDTPLSINSGFRCKRHNARVGGASESYHTYGIAADIATPRGLTDVEFYELAQTVPAFRDGGCGIYDGRIHVDVRNGTARWDNRRKK